MGLFNTIKRNKSKNEILEWLYETHYSTDSDTFRKRVDEVSKRNKVGSKELIDSVLEYLDKE